jgi:hypothetical protein
MILDFASILNAEKTGFLNSFFRCFRSIDLDILSRIDYKCFSPKVIIAETVVFGSFRKETTIKEYLTTKGYAAPYETPINTIFVRKDCWEKMI